MNPQKFAWKVGGAAGEGIMSTGLLFSKTCARHGLYIFDYTEYPSLIRGGHNTYQVHAGSNPVYTHESKIDVLVALNRDGVELHLDELNDQSIVIFDEADDRIEIEKYQLKAKAINVPLVQLVKKAGGKEVMANNVALGASVYLLGLKLSILDEVIADVFGGKGEEIVNLNQKAAKAGYDYIKTKVKPLLSINKQEKKLLSVSGNEAIALGALAGGLQFYVAYPMTPASSILHFLAAKSKEADIAVKHAEDEIGAANMALGASFAGARTMIGTSGGGFCYMTEALGFAGISELPIVFVEVMRPGPALGLPTWTEQGDLKFVLNASNGEFPHIVLAPGDAQEAFELARISLDLAEKYQLPVILLSDKYLSESRHTFIPEKYVFENKRWGFDLKPSVDNSGFYPRYMVTDDGISKRSMPGTYGGNYINNSYVHNKYGLSTEEAEDRKQMTDKTFKKFEKIKKEILKQFAETEEDSKATLISFGSTKGALIRAKAQLKKLNIPVNIFNLSWIWPFPADQVTNMLKDSQNVVVVEGNSQGQLASLITQETGYVVKNKLGKYDGRPFDYQEIVKYVKGL